METYLQRLYLSKKEEEEAPKYPVWDYRSRRSSLSTALSCGDGSTLSSAGSSRSEIELSESGSSLSSGSGSDVDLMALRDPARLTFDLVVDPHEVRPLLDLYEPLIGWVDSDLRLFHACGVAERFNDCGGIRNSVQIASGKGCGIKNSVQITSGKDCNIKNKFQNSTGKGCSTSTCTVCSSMKNSVQNKLNDNELISRCDQHQGTVLSRQNRPDILSDSVAAHQNSASEFSMATHQNNSTEFNVAAQNGSNGWFEKRSFSEHKCSENERFSNHTIQPFSEEKERTLPSLAVVLFLYEEDARAGGRIDNARRHFEKSPWKLHHCEQAQRRNLNLSRHALDYFFISDDLPLWAVRQVHYGKEHIRVVVHTKEDSWSDMVQFYKLILGLEPDLLRDDFCLFTVYSQINFDIQFALKRRDMTSALSLQPVPMQSAKLKFKVADIGRLVPLFPNVCQPVSDSCWLTTDHDGNEVILDVTGHYASSSSGASSGSERASSESCASASSSDVSFDSHDSGVSHGSVFISDGKNSSIDPSLDNSKRRKSRGVIKEPGENKKSQRRVTFCFDDVPPRHPSPPPSPSSLPPPPSVPPPPYPSAVKARSPKPFTPSATADPPESRFNLRFDTCPTAPLLGNKRREEQIGFYV